MKSNTLYTSRWSDLGLSLIAGIIFCIPAFQNHFPFIYPDTGAYIHAGFTNTVPIDRPIFYGWFIRHISLSDSLWLVVLAQSSLLAWLLLQVVKSFFINNYKTIFLLLSTGLILTTSIGYVTGLLIPDVFTPMTFLSIYLLLFCNQNISKKIFISSLLIYSIAVHNSHIYILFLVLFSMTFIYFFKKYFKIIFTLNRLLFVWAIWAFSILAVNTVNWGMNAGFRPSQASHVFLMARLNEFGILHLYLDEQCEKNHHALCDYQDQLPIDFLWDPASPLQKTGGWEGSEVYYKKVLFDILSNPKYLIKFGSRSLENILVQFFSFDVNRYDIGPVSKEHPAMVNIRGRFPELKLTSELSIQHLGRLDFTIISWVENIVFFISFAFSIWFLMTESSRLMDQYQHYRWLFIFLYIGLFANAWVCETFSTVANRFQSRISWLIPATVALIIVQMVINNREKAASRQQG